MKKKGKHSQKEDKKALKFNLLVIGILICIIIVIGIIKYSKNTYNEEDIEVAEESIETVNTEGIIIEETIDNNIENLINNIMIENDLDESNFFFFYYNIDNKKYYFYNMNTYFTAASTIKVPIAMLYYDKIREGELNLTDTILYNSEDYEEGDGNTAADYSIGEKIPISYLLEEMIVNSDNTAVNILMNNLGYSECKKEISKYSNVELIEDFYTSNIVNASYYYDVLQYLFQNSDKYEELIEYMKISSGGGYLKASLSQYEVAHKYGSYDGYVHDFGIIYGENTYLIGVFTRDIKNASELISKIGKEVVQCSELDE